MSSLKDHTWHKIANNLAEINFSPNGMTEIAVNGKTICLALHNNTLHACTQKCPHAGGILSQGFIDATGNIVCPLHHYRYNMQNGRNTSGEGYYLKTFAVEVRNDGVFIQIADSSLFG